jgi:SNF2 family DNA or RNA helicase
MINLYEYQKRYLSELPSRAIMAADTGTGKTFMALAHYNHYFGYRNGLGEPEWGYSYQMPLLILAPASKIRTKDWERDIAEYFGDNPPEYKIYSYEQFSRNVTMTQFKKGKRSIWHEAAPRFGGRQYAVIADEIHRAKNPQSGIGKAVYEATKDAAFFVGLSATPLPNGWIDFANYSKIFGFTKNITAFKKRYCNYVDYKGFPELKNYWHEDELKTQWQSVSKRLKKSEALDLPAKTFKGVDFKRPAEYMKLILTRETPDGQILDTAPALAHACRQTLTTPKLDYLAEIIEGTDENIVIFYNYVSEREAILEMLSKKFKDRQVFRQDGDCHQLPAKEVWKDVNRTVTVSHYRSGSTGVEMTYATQVVYFSPTYSYADYMQSIGRVYRNGQTQKTTFYNFRTPNSIEEEVYKALINKQDFQALQWRPQK